MQGYVYKILVRESDGKRRPQDLMVVAANDRTKDARLLFEKQFRQMLQGRQFILGWISSIDEPERAYIFGCGLEILGYLHAAAP
jgi:hypothetical protein